MAFLSTVVKKNKSRNFIPGSTFCKIYQLSSQITNFTKIRPKKIVKTKLKYTANHEKIKKKIGRLYFGST